MSNFTDAEREDLLNWSGFARHTWRLLVEYDDLSSTLPSKDRHDVTLALTALQAMLTNCVDLQKHSHDAAIEQMQPIHEFVASLRGDPDVAYHVHEPPIPGLDQRSEADDLLAHVRNALSHPRIHAGPRITTTGFSTSADAADEIATVTFVDSPDLTSLGEPKRRSRRYPHVRQNPDLARTYALTLPVPLLKAFAEEVAFALAADAMTDLDQGVRKIRLASFREPAHRQHADSDSLTR